MLYFFLSLTRYLFVSSVDNEPSTHKADPEVHLFVTGT